MNPKVSKPSTSNEVGASSPIKHPHQEHSSADQDVSLNGFPAHHLDSSVSHGTLRTQDLLPAFLDVLKEVDAATHAGFMLMPFGPIPSHAMEDQTADWWNSEEASWRMEEVEDALNAAAPEGYYFGAIEGDDSDFGFWQTEEEEPKRVNINCLEGMACPECGQNDMLLIDVQGFLEGDNSDEPSTATVMMTDDGFDSPLFDGHTEWTGGCSCPDCKFEGNTEDFKVKKEVSPAEALRIKGFAESFLQANEGPKGKAIQYLYNELCDGDVEVEDVLSEALIKDGYPKRSAEELIEHLRGVLQDKTKPK